jgi:hypothetical protein
MMAEKGWSKFTEEYEEPESGQKTCWRCDEIMPSYEGHKKEDCIESLAVRVRTLFDEVKELKLQARDGIRTK